MNKRPDEESIEDRGGAADVLARALPDTLFLSAAEGGFDGVRACRPVRTVEHEDGRIGLVAIIDPPLDSRQGVGPNEPPCVVLLPRHRDNSIADPRRSPVSVHVLQPPAPPDAWPAPVRLSSFRNLMWAELFAARPEGDSRVSGRPRASQPRARPPRVDPRQYEPTRGSRAWAATWPWLVAFAVVCGWDRAVWLLTTRGGRPVLEFLEVAKTPAALAEALQRTLALHASGAADLVMGVAYGLVYQFGRLPVWIIVAVAVIFEGWRSTDPERVREALRRGLWVVAVPAIGGALAEVLKLVARRLRPEHFDGRYGFKSLANLLDAGGVGLASSHAAVAVAGALTVGALRPSLRGPLLALAALTCLSRVAVGAHFLSDVVAGVGLGWLAYRVAYDRARLGAARSVAAQAPAPA